MNLLMVRVSQGLHCENKKAPFENKDRINRDSSGAARAISTRFREKNDVVLKNVETTQANAKRPSSKRCEILPALMLLSDQLAALLADERLGSAIARADKARVLHEEKRPAKTCMEQRATSGSKP